MKNTITLMLCITLFSGFLTAQTNLITNPGFEDNSTTVTDAVYNPGTLLLMRISSTTATATATSQPATTSATVNDGVWYKKQSVSSSILNAYHQPSDARSGTNCLMMRNGGGSGSTGISWSNFNFQQRVALDNTKKYTLTFWAKKLFTVNSVKVFIADASGNYGGSVFAVNVPLSGGTTWTKYTVPFDVPYIRSLNAALDYTTAYVGVGYDVTYDSNSKTVTGQILYDDFSLTESTTPVITSSLSSPTNVQPIPVTITFNHAVTGFDSSDIVVTNGTLNNFAGSGATYTAGIIPSASGDVTVDIAADAAVDGAENNTLAATQFVIAYDNTTGVPDTKGLLSAYSEGQSIVISAKSGQTATIFTVQGQLFKSVVLTSETTNVPASTGFYIVKVDGAVSKVLVK